ncbi:Transglutaminase-like enzyme, putative cysteine protease [Thalassovita litoralis]|jgi:transglutaminase-like putative cysteine protease|uniref:Transglutaminase-like enzyme, putative cysteine protease n=1 Tax=Thalassovita litoralis TaxID=1010611 RepID=A0A521DZM1_9RHOB|nr:transglutaminase family protein [Thalassovita litoralis]SMO77156.1 Transglutaminase-like enzyme, putative cysteine protease [Thalassovita litoralis]
MRLSISHVTTYTYDSPDAYALLQLRLKPRDGHGQHVHDWTTTITGGTQQLGFDDEYGNHVDLILVDPDTTELTIASKGVVEIEDRAGVVGEHKTFTPLWLYEAPTPMTTPGKSLRKLVAGLKPLPDETELARIHRLSDAVSKQVAYETGHTTAATTAEEALTAGHGVCQDHAHIMIAAARLMGLPARYISGYLMMDDREDQDAAHAWAEIWIDRLGWVGFDAANEICPDARYVRVAVGRDYRDAAPVHGIRQGTGSEDLHVALKVQAQTDQ